VQIEAEPKLDDDILFASCLPDLLCRARRVVLACDPRLAPLLARSFPTAIVQPRDAQVEPIDCDVQLAIGDLPRIYRRQMADFPQRLSYLVADRARTADWQERFAELGDGLKVGVLWKSKTAETAGEIAAWDQWRRILSVAGIQFISLQADAPASQLEAARVADAASLGKVSANLDELAAQLAALDLLISIDDIAAHLAGALGTPVWTLLNYAWGWRWMLDRDDSPWYPSMRLFRPRRINAWPEMMDRVRHALIDLVAGDIDARCDDAHPLVAPPRARSVSHRGEMAWP
jgi:hypothetical protein